MDETLQPGMLCFRNGLALNVQRRTGSVRVRAQRATDPIVHSGAFFASRHARAALAQQCPHMLRERETCVHDSRRDRERNETSLCATSEQTRDAHVCSHHAHTPVLPHIRAHGRGTWRARISARYAPAFFLLDVRRTLPAGHVLVTLNTIGIVRPAVAVEHPFRVASVLVAAAARVPRGRGTRGRYVKLQYTLRGHGTGGLSRLI